MQQHICTWLVWQLHYVQNLAASFNMYKRDSSPARATQAHMLVMSLVCLLVCTDFLLIVSIKSICLKGTSVAPHKASPNNMCHNIANECLPIQMFRLSPRFEWKGLILEPVWLRQEISQCKFNVCAFTSAAFTHIADLVPSGCIVEFVEADLCALGTGEGPWGCIVKFVEADLCAWRRWCKDGQGPWNNFPQPTRHRLHYRYTYMLQR